MTPARRRTRRTRCDACTLLTPQRTVRCSDGISRCPDCRDYDGYDDRGEKASSADDRQIRNYWAARAAENR